MDQKALTLLRVGLVIMDVFCVMVNYAWQL